MFFGQKVQAFMKNYQTKRRKMVLTAIGSDQDHLLRDVQMKTMR